MSYAPMKVSGKGVAKAECPICGFVWRNNQLLKRWDGKMVCPKCWEQRHPLDFYRTINDTFPLAYVNPQSIETTYTPVFSALTEVVGTEAVTKTGRYTSNTDLAKLNFLVQIAITGTATTAQSGGTVTLPVTSVLAGTFRVLDTNSTIIGSGTISASATTLALPTWTARNKSINITGIYGI